MKMRISVPRDDAVILYTFMQFMAAMGMREMRDFWFQEDAYNGTYAIAAMGKK